MNVQSSGDEHPPRQIEHGGIIIDKPKTGEEEARERQLEKENGYKEDQVRTNRRLTLLNSLLVAGTFITSGLGIWQAQSSQTAARAARDAVKTAGETLQEMRSGGGAQDTHTLAQQAVSQSQQTTKLATDTHTLAESASRQASSTKIIATEALVQAQAAKQSATAAHDLVETNRESFEVSQRPWLISSATIASPLEFDKEGAHLTVRYVVVNVGHTPATGVEIKPELFREGLKDANEIEARKGLCDEMDRHIGTFGTTVFPGQPLVQDYTISVPESQLQSAIDETQGYMSLHLIDCVSYHSKFVSKHFHFGTSYDLHYKDPSSGHLLMPHIGRTLRIEELELDLSAFDPIDVQ